MTRWFHRKNVGNVLASVMAVLLGLAALFSLTIGVRHALALGSSDLQWGGSHLLWGHVDPWMQRLDQPTLHSDHFSPPNYLHLLYVVLWPLALLPFATAQAAWCACSVLCSIVVVVLLTRFYDLTTREGFVVLALLWMSSPFRVVLEVGQISMFELLFFCLAFTARTPVVRGLSLGFSAVKYSFAPVTWAFLFWRRKFLVPLVATALCVVGLFSCFLLLDTPLLRLACEPFLVSRIAVNPGVADWMTLIEFGLRGNVGVHLAQTISYYTAMIASCAFAFMLSRLHLRKGAELCLLSIASLLFFKHLIYDYVFLVIALSYAMSLRKWRWLRAPVLAVVFLFWFASSHIVRASTGMHVNLTTLFLQCLVITSLLGYTLWLTSRMRETTA